LGGLKPNGSGYRNARWPVDKRQRRTADSRGFYTYYFPTAMGHGLEHGVEELMRRERAFDERYA